MKSKMRTWNVAMGSLSLLFLCVSPALAIATNPSQENPSTERKDNSVTQQRTRKVTGVVLDANGESIIGANVVVKGTNNGTITDLDGKFSIELSDGETLQVSFIGYNSKDVMVGAGENHIKVQLREDTQKLDEVVVVGYGTQIKRAVTGSVQSIKSEEMADMPVAQSRKRCKASSPVSKSIKYPVIAQENGIQGRVICAFVVNRDGSVVDAEVLRGVDPSLDKEALRVIGTMPKWTPGKQRGKPVRVKYTVPITFRLQ